MPYMYRVLILHEQVGALLIVLLSFFRRSATTRVQAPYVIVLAQNCDTTRTQQG